MEKTLKEKTTSALIWSFIDKFGQQVIYLISGIVLARILSPDDYGLIGSLVFFTALCNILVGSGYGRALFNLQKLRQEDTDTVFYYNIGMGIFFYVLLFFCAPLISQFFRQPALTALARVLFISIVFNAVFMVQDTLFSKKMELKKQTRINLYSLLPASVIAILAAVYGLGVWSLVLQTVLLAFFKMIFNWMYSTWRPKGSFNKQVLKDLYPFSSRVLATNLVSTVFNNIYFLLIGRFYYSQLGFYTNANKYQEIPMGLISNTFRSVSIPLLSGVNQDTERLKRVLSKLMKTLALVTFPVLIGMILIAKPLFIVLITEKWLASVPLFKILCLSGIFFVMNNVLQESILAKGRSGELLLVEILKKVVLVSLIVFTLKYGVIGLAWGWAASNIITLFLSLYLSKKFVGYSAWHLLKDCFPYAAISTVLCGVAWLLTQSITNNYLFLGVCVSFVGILYVLSCRLFKLEASEEMFDWLIRKKASIRLKNK
jgi:teichuronic acid exporter